MFRNLRHRAPSAPKNSSTAQSIGSSLWVFAALASVGFLGQYLLAGRFGLYEDDYFFTSAAYSWDFNQMVAYFQDAWRAWPQFRPLGFSLTHALTWLTAQAPSLTTAYYSGLAIQAVNAWLLYRICLTRCPAPAAFFAAALFLLYPSDTGKTILMLRVFQHLNLTFILAALLLYSQRRTSLALATAACSLLIYEHFYLGFLVAPLLVVPLDPPDWKSLLKRYALLALPPAILLAARYFLGDSRAGDVVGSPTDALAKSLQAMAIGPRTAFLALVERPTDALRFSGYGHWLVILLAAAISFFAIRHCSSKSEPAAAGRPKSRGAALWFALLSLGCMAASYLLAIRPDNFPPVVNLGRLSGFNAPGSIACTLLLASLAGLLFNLRPEWPKQVVGALLSVYLGLLASYGYEIQRQEYVRHWEQQRSALETLIATSSEWTPGTALVVDMDSGHATNLQTPGFAAFWLAVNLPWTIDAYTDLARAAETPWVAKVRAYGFTRGLGFTETEGSVKLHTPPQDPSLHPSIADSNFLLFKLVDGQLARSSEPWRLNDRDYLPRQLVPGSGVPHVTPNRLHRLLFTRSKTSPIPASTWPSYQRGINYPR